MSSSDDLDPDRLRRMAQRLDELFIESDEGAAATLRACADKIERLRAELESERAEHEAWKRLAQIPEPITPEDIGMVRWDGPPPMPQATAPLWRFPDGH